MLAYGHARKGDLPADGGKPKVCPKCDLWFSALPRMRVCLPCKRPSERARQAITLERLEERQNPQVKDTYSDALGVTFKPGVPPWRILALEEAAKIDGKL
jgi:hypothetical protein